MPIWARAAVLLWLVFVSLYDARTHTVPPWATWPIIVGVALGRAWSGAWVPLLLLALLFVWDTTVADVKGLLGRTPREGDETRWLLPDGVAWTAVGVLVFLAGRQGEGATVLAVGWAVIHGLWRFGILPGGDAALVMDIAALFPHPRFFWVEGAGILVATVPLLLWQYRRDIPVVLATGDVSLLKAVYATRSRPRPVAWAFALGGVILALT